MPEPLLPGKSTFIFPDAAQSWYLLEILFSGRSDCPCLGPLWLLHLLLSQHLFHFTGLIFRVFTSAALAVCWINTALAGEGILNLFIKWINTELPQSHQSQHCPLGSQNKPALVSQGKPSGVRVTSHFKADGNDSPYKRGCDYAVSKAGHMMDI